VTGSEAPAVRDNEDEGRFEVAVEGGPAVLDYRRGDGRLVLVHTGVPRELEGAGIGGSLVQAAVDAAERQGLTLVPSCSFARDWLERNPDEAARVTVA
jgi:uncharacterized protein